VSLLWAIVPVKPLNQAKSRLAPALDGEQRAYLALAMLRRVVTLLVEAPEVLGVLVVSRDPRALAEARDLGAHTVQESGAPALNPAIARATQVARAMGAATTLVMPADLPLLSLADLRGIVDLACDALRSVVIAPDRHETGTNALLTCPPGVIQYTFVLESFKRHLALAEDAGVAAHVWRSPTLALVLDQYPRSERGRRISRIAEAAAREAGMDVIPTEGYYEKYGDGEVQLHVSRWEGHPNELANEIFTQMLASHLGLLEAESGGPSDSELRD